MVWRASDFVDPINLMGPRLIHPVAYRPGRWLPLGSVTAPFLCGILRFSWSNGTSGNGVLA